MVEQTSAFTSAGAKLSVSASLPATHDAAGFAALSYTEVGEITDIPAFGRTYAEVTHKPVNKRATFKFKGSYDDGGTTLTMARGTADAANDPGQAVLKTFLNSDNDLSVKVEYNDNPDGTSNSIDYFRAKVLSMPNSIGAADAIVTRQVQLSINGDIVEVAAVA